MSLSTAESYSLECHITDIMFDIATDYLLEGSFDSVVMTMKGSKNQTERLTSQVSGYYLIDINTFTIKQMDNFIAC